LLVRIVRRLTLEEVLARIQALEEKYGMTFDEFEELFLEGRINRQVVGTYFEWASLVHAYRRYVEEGELDYVLEEIREMNLNDVARLTPKRLELLYTLANMRVESINDLAKKVRRNVKNVYQDLQALKDLGFITFRRKGKRNILPEALIEELTFLIR